MPDSRSAPIKVLRQAIHANEDYLLITIAHTAEGDAGLEIHTSLEHEAQLSLLKALILALSRPPN
jgi:hypothetical protein